MKSHELWFISFWKKQLGQLKRILIPDIDLLELIHNTFQVMLIVLVPTAIIIYIITRPAPTLIQAKLLVNRITFNINKNNSLKNEKTDLFLEAINFKKIEIQKGFLETEIYIQNKESLQIKKGPSNLYPNIQIEIATPSTLSATLSHLELKNNSKITLEYLQRINYILRCLTEKLYIIYL